MSNPLTYQDFEPYLQQAFLTSVEQVPKITLIEVKRLRDGYQPGARDQFSLLFVGPAAPILPQQTYVLRHQQMGEVRGFLVPVGRQNNHHDPSQPLLYQAVYT